MLKQFKIASYAMFFVLGTVIILPLKLTAQAKDALSPATDRLPKKPQGEKRR